MIEQDNLRPAGWTLPHQHIPGMGVTVYVAVVKDHLAVHLTHLTAHVIQVHTLATQP